MADEQPLLGCCGLFQVVANSAEMGRPICRSDGYYEMAMRRLINYYKQRGSYMGGTSKETDSSGDYTDLGYKDECKPSSTVKDGDKSGCADYSQQEKVTRVAYNNKNNCRPVDRSWSLNPDNNQWPWE